MKIELDKKNLNDVYVSEGDKLEIHYAVKPPFVNVKKSLIYLVLNKKKDFRLISLKQPNADEIIVTVVSIHSPIPVALIVVAITSILVSFFIYGSLKNVYKISEEAPKITFPIMASVLGLLAFAGVVVAKKR